METQNAVWYEHTLGWFSETVEIDLSFFLRPEIQLGAVAIVGLFYLIKDLGLIIWKRDIKSQASKLLSQDL
jgi:hypothetical protein